MDGEGRPLFAYGKRIHDQCSRRAHFDAGQFVEVFDDEAARKGWCLYQVGCKGPATFSPCPIFQWNTRTSWPIGAGHPCIGCTEPNFWDTMTPFYGRLPNVAGFRSSSGSTLIGAALADRRGGRRRRSRRGHRRARRSAAPRAPTQPAPPETAPADTENDNG